MIPVPHFRGTTIAVLGLGPGGLAAVRALVASGAEVISWDADGPRCREAMSIGASVQVPDGWCVDEFTAIVFADGQRGPYAAGLASEADAEDVPCLGELDLFQEALTQVTPEGGKRRSIVAVSGALGKSLTASMIAHMLREHGREVSVGGDHGAPLMAMKLLPPHAVYVIETGVPQLRAATRFAADVTVVPNLLPDASPDEADMVARTMLNLFTAQSPGGTAVIGVDDIIGQKVCTLLGQSSVPAHQRPEIIPVSGEAALSHGVFTLEETAYSARARKTQMLGNFSRASIAMAPHCRPNVAAAMAAVVALDVPPAMMIKALHSFRGLEGRFEWLGTSGPLMFVDDSHASCRHAATEALKACLDVFWIGSNASVCDDVAKGTATPLGALQGTYLVGAGMPHADLDQAVKQAVTDARALVERDPDAAPVILCAPGVPEEERPYKASAFRTIVRKYMASEVRYG